jgi:hypothetical protein
MLVADSHQPGRSWRRTVPVDGQWRLLGEKGRLDEHSAVVCWGRSCATDSVGTAQFLPLAVDPAAEVDQNGAHAQPQPGCLAVAPRPGSAHAAFRVRPVTWARTSGTALTGIMAATILGVWPSGSTSCIHRGTTSPRHDRPGAGGVRRMPSGSGACWPTACSSWLVRRSVRSTPASGSSRHPTRRPRAASSPRTQVAVAASRVLSCGLTSWGSCAAAADDGQDFGLPPGQPNGS